MRTRSQHRFVVLYWFSSFSHLYSFCCMSFFFSLPLGVSLHPANCSHPEDYSYHAGAEGVLMGPEGQGQIIGTDTQKMRMFGNVVWTMSDGIGGKLLPSNTCDEMRCHLSSLACFSSLLPCVRRTFCRHIDTHFHVFVLLVHTLQTERRTIR